MAEMFGRRRNVVERLCCWRKARSVPEDVQLTLPLGAGAAGGFGTVCFREIDGTLAGEQKAVKKRSSSRRFGANNFT